MIDERGLAGSSDLDGIPWTMPMEQVFEAWVETIVCSVARRTGGVLRTGRKREMVASIAWDPPDVGSQRSLVPDLILGTEDAVIMVDAKYKPHWEEMHEVDWRGQPEELREEHRSDVLQVLTYANPVNAREVVCCLVYPCTMTTWASLARRGRLFRQSELPNRGGRVRLWLTAGPRSGVVEEVGN